MFDLGQARSELLDRPVMVVSRTGEDDEPARSILPALKPRVQVHFTEGLEQARDELGLSAGGGEAGGMSRIRPSVLVVCGGIGEAGVRELFEGLQQDPALSMTPVLVLPCGDAADGSLVSEGRHAHCRVLEGAPDAAAVREGLADLGMAWLVENERQPD